MAKKAKKAKAPAKVKPAKKNKPAKRSWSGGAERAKEVKRTVKAPTQPPLIKGLRIRAIDKVFEQIADTRGAMNRLRGEEADLERQAHRLMREHKQTTWVWAGVEASRVPGEEKLRIRTSRETSSAASEGESSSSTGTGDTDDPNATEPPVDPVEGEAGDSTEPTE